MNKIKSIRYRLLCLIFLYFISIVCYANKAQELNKINKVIKNLQQDLSKSVSKQTVLQKQLKVNEEERGALAISRKKTDNQLKQQQFLYDKLCIKQKLYQNQLEEQRNILGQQMRAAYMLGEQSYFKILLNQDDPTKINRTLVYHKYLQDFRWQFIVNLNQTIQNIKNNQSAIYKQQQKLLTIKNEQILESKKLKILQNDRITILNNTDLKIKSQQQKLKELFSQKKELEKIIAKLASSSTAKFVPANAPWQKAIWPTHGIVHYLFGTPVVNSQLKWDGVLIDAPEGQKVYAMGSGKVIFSQWLQGYGLLLIIDHGHGYMSLYGRNNSLYKKVGDKITKGDVVAEVGNSGGYERPSLYFAIRYNGKPVDPKIWCKN